MHIHWQLHMHLTRIQLTSTDTTSETNTEKWNDEIKCKKYFRFTVKRILAARNQAFIYPSATPAECFRAFPKKIGWVTKNRRVDEKRYQLREYIMLSDKFKKKPLQSKCKYSRAANEKVSEYCGWFDASFLMLDACRAAFIHYYY